MQRPKQQPQVGSQKVAEKRKEDNRLHVQSRLRTNIQNMIVEELGDDPSALEAFMDQVEEEGFL